MSERQEGAMTAPEALIAEIMQEAQETARWTGRDRFDARVLQAMRNVRREAFVPTEAIASAYVNAPLHIGCGQTISQPFIVALMTDLLDLHPKDRVLEVGTGSGYQTAILAELAGEVFSIEVILQLADRALQVLQAEGYRHIVTRVGDGALGWPEHAPFDAIIVTAAARDVPHALVEQLQRGGRLVIPVGKPYGEQELRLLQKDKDGHVTSRSVLAVAFVPLTRPNEIGS
jgi:protein-L-isoaspartate(D-aspartate) O-methyltransferase